MSIFNRIDEVPYWAQETILDSQDKIARLEKEIAELRVLLSGANDICNRIANLVDDRGQYRDLVEAVEMKLKGF